MRVERNTLIVKLGIYNALCEIEDINVKNNAKCVRKHSSSKDNKMKRPVLQNLLNTRCILICIMQNIK